MCNFPSFLTTSQMYDMMLQLLFSFESKIKVHTFALDTHMCSMCITYQIIVFVVRQMFLIVNNGDQINVMNQLTFIIYKSSCN